MRLVDAFELDQLDTTVPVVQPSDHVRNAMFNALHERRLNSDDNELSFVDSEFSPYLQTRMNSSQRCERARRLREIHSQREKSIAESMGVAVRDYTPTPTLSFQREDFQSRVKRRKKIRTGGLGNMPWKREEG